MRKFSLLFFVLCCATWARAEEITGRVIAPDGKALAAAKVFYSRLSGWREWREIPVGEDGAFQVEVKPADLTVAEGQNAKNKMGRIVAWDENFGLSGAWLRRGETNEIPIGPPREVSGSVREENGKGLANVAVGVEFFDLPRRKDDDDHIAPFITIPAALADRFKTRSDATGNWKIGGLPANAMIRVVIQDEEYLPYVTLFGHVGQSSAFRGGGALKSARAGIIGGRVLDAEGKPAANVSLRAVPHEKPQTPTIQNSGGYARSDAEGRFRIARLKPGIYNVTIGEPISAYRLTPIKDAAAADKKPPLVARAVEGVRVEAGKTASADLNLVAPAFVKGRVFDRASGDPIGNVNVGAFGAHAPRSGRLHALALSDDEGRFEIALVPGPAALYAFQLDDRSTPGAKDAPVEVRVEAAAGQIKTQSLFFTPRYVPLVGTISDETGATVEDVRLAAGREYGTGNLGVTQPDGTFRFERLPVGELVLWINDKTGAQYDLVSPKTVSLPRPKNEKLKVVLRRAATAELAGRVVSQNGAPVAGAEVRFQLSFKTHEGHDARSFAKAVSGADGRFSLGQMRVSHNPVFSAVEKPDAKFERGGEVVVKENAFLVSDIVAQTLAREIAGVVRDGTGAPVSGARVRASGDEYSREATSDAQGRFVLPSQPEGKVELLAAKGHALARIDVSANQKTPLAISLREATPAVFPDAERALLAFQKQAAAGSDRNTLEKSARALSPLAPDAALALFLEAQQLSDDRKAAPKSNDEARVEIIHALTRKEISAANANWANAQLLEIENGASWNEAATSLGRALVISDEPRARELLREAKARLDGNNAVHIARVAALAARLKDADAESLFQSALAAGKAAPGVLVMPLAHGSIEWTEAVLETLPRANQLRESLYAILISSGWNVAGARRLLARMARVLAEMPEEERKNWSATFSQSSKYVILAIGPTDAAAAHEIARAVDDDWNRSGALAMGAAFGTAAERAAMAREAEAAGGAMSMTATRARLAASLQNGAPDAASAFFAETWQEIENNRRRMGESYGLSEYAFYLAESDPARARLLLEAQWAHVQKLVAFKKENAFSRDWERAGIAGAMAAFDFERALEMAGVLPAQRIKLNPSPRARAMEKIGRIMLTPPSLRWRFPWGDESGFDMLD